MPASTGLVTVPLLVALDSTEAAYPLNGGIPSHPSERLETLSVSVGWLLEMALLAQGAAWVCITSPEAPRKKRGTGTPWVMHPELFSLKPGRHTTVH